MGGWGTPNTSSILKDNSVPGSGRLHWQKGPDLIGQGALYSCAVSIGEDGALLVGGILEPRQVVHKRGSLTWRCFRWWNTETATGATGPL